MIKTISITVPDDIGEKLTDCKPGDTYSVEFTVDNADQENGTLTGTASDVEGYEEEEKPEEETPKEESGGNMERMKHKMPKAVIMVGMGK